MKTENEIQEQIEYLTKAIEKYSQYKQSCNEKSFVYQVMQSMVDKRDVLRWALE